MYCFYYRKRSLCATSIVLLFSISQGKTLEGKGCDCSSRDGSDDVRSVVVEKKKNSSNVLADEEIVCDVKSTDLGVENVFYDENGEEKHVNYNIDFSDDKNSEISVDKVKSGVDDVYFNVPDKEDNDVKSVKNDVNLNVNSGVGGYSEVFKELNEIINKLKESSPDSISNLLKSLHDVESGLCKDGKIENSQLIDANRRVCGILIELLKKEFLSLGIDEGISKLLVVDCGKYSSILSDVDRASQDFERISSFIELLDVNKVTTICNLAKESRNVLKGIKDVESTISYRVYSCIASILFKFVVGLQDKLIFLFPSLYNGKVQNGLCVRLDVKNKDFVEDIGDLKKLCKLVYRMLDCKFVILRELKVCINGINEPIFVVSGEVPDAINVSSSNIGVLGQILNLFNEDSKCEFFKFLDKHIYSLKPEDPKKINEKKLKTLRDVIGAQDINFETVRLKNVISKKNNKLPEINYI